uniref:Ig-like domain-containing protein n=1 Tax=Sphaeramia orbicularis TaxID=375764 RepID=A0A672ZBA8_9TELE
MGNHFICLTSYPDVPTTLEQGQSGLIRPPDLLPLKHSPIFIVRLSSSLMLCSSGVQPQVVTSSQPIIVFLGNDVMLPCHLDPVVDVSDMTVEWIRPDLEPRFVHVWRDGVDLQSKSNSRYRGRTSVSTDRLSSGDVSLRLSTVRLSDEGTYRCFIPHLGHASVQLSGILSESQILK